MNLQQILLTLLFVIFGVLLFIRLRRERAEQRESDLLASRKTLDDMIKLLETCLHRTHVDSGDARWKMVKYVSVDTLSLEECKHRLESIIRELGKSFIHDLRAHRAAGVGQNLVKINEHKKAMSNRVSKSAQQKSATLPPRAKGSK